MKKRVGWVNHGGSTPDKLWYSCTTKTFRIEIQRSLIMHAANPWVARIYVWDPRLINMEFSAWKIFFVGKTPPPLRNRLSHSYRTSPSNFLATLKRFSFHSAQDTYGKVR